MILQNARSAFNPTPGFKRREKPQYSNAVKVSEIPQFVMIRRRAVP